MPMYSAAEAPRTRSGVAGSAASSSQSLLQVPRRTPVPSGSRRTSPRNHAAGSKSKIPKSPKRGRSNTSEASRTFPLCIVAVRPSFLLVADPRHNKQPNTSPSVGEGEADADDDAEESD